MTKIKEIFGSDKDIYRSIEKVVTFGNASEINLKNEVSEYVVTEKLKENFDKILNRNEENNFNHSIVYSDDEQQESETNCVKSVSFGNLNITVSKKVSAPIES